MDVDRRSSIAFGLILLLVGGFFLAAQIVPQLKDFIRIDYVWPLWVVGVGLFFLVMAVAVRASGLAVPASIIAGIGGILYYQNATGDWASWAYAWALIPGFVGVGVIIMNILEGRFLRGLSEGLMPILVSLIMFGIFASFLGGRTQFNQLWPLLLIGLGVLIMLKGWVGKRKDVDVVQNDKDNDTEMKL